MNALNWQREKRGGQVKQEAGPDGFKAQFENTFKHFVFEKYVRHGRLNTKEFLEGVVRKNYGVKAQRMVSALARGSNEP